MHKAAILTILLPAVLHAQQAVKPRILFDVDTSGSMGWEVCDPCVICDGVDHTTQCPGQDVSCTDCPGAVGCGNAIPDDGRLWKVKQALNEVVTAFGEVEFGLERFHMEPIAFACPQGGWEGADGITCLLNPLGSGDNAGDILVEFGPNNQGDILEWLDLGSNTPGIPSPVGCGLCDDCGTGCDKELRAHGATPLAGSIATARAYLNAVRTNDEQRDCRPYGLIVLSDGENNCKDADNPSDPDPTPEQAEAVCDLGIPVHVIGFASPAIVDRLNEIAEAGCGPNCNDTDGDGTLECKTEAIMVDNETTLALAFADIIQASIRVELCNGQDDDCDCPGDTNGDGTVCGPGDEGVDEDFVTLGTPCGKGACTGVICCASETTTECCAPEPTCEVCNRVDDDCDGLVDNNIDADGVPPCVPAFPPIECECFPEECNGYDDDCDCPGDTNGDGTTCGPGDLNVDEEPLATSGYPCGTSVGECVQGLTCCVDSTPSCCGEIGPSLEICDCKDNDCNGFTDERSDAPCFTLGDGCDPLTGLCEGICLLGGQECVDLDPGPGCIPGAGECLGQRGPQTELCNCIDDDCDAQTDEDVICPGGGRCENCVCPLNCDPDDEFPCAAGFNCECAPEGDCECGEDAISDPECANNWFCQVDVCLGVTCGACEYCDPAEGGLCQTLCGNAIECESWQKCDCDHCVDVSCTNPDETVCPEDETCDPVRHECVRDPCLDIECGEDEYCRSDNICTTPDNLCVPACPLCPEDQHCVCGVCVDDPCAGTACLANQVCCDGSCVANPCVTLACDPGQRCDPCTGACLPDSCALGRIECPSDDYLCRENQCQLRIVVDPDRQTLSASGAGGCACRVASTPRSGDLPWVLLVGLALVWVRRRP